MNPLHCLLILISSFTLATGHTLAAYQCESNPDAPPVAEPYAGEAPTGYKGALERDANWFRMVSTVTRRDGATRYVLTRQPAQSRRQFESIVPVHLGGKHFGVVGYRQGCGELLYSDGTPAVVERFTDLSFDSWNGDLASKHVRLQLNFTGGSEAKHTYVRFTNGRKSAESPRHYLSSASWDISLLRAGRERQLRIEAAAVPGAFGVVDMATLREVLRPEWERITIVQATRSSASREPNGPAYLVATKEGSRLFSLSGKPVDIPLFDEIEVLYNFFLPLSPGGSPDPMLWRTIDRKANGCMLYSMAFRPLIPTPVPIDGRGKCPADRWKDSLSFAFTDSDGKTQMYRKELAGSEGMLIRTAASIDGTIVFHYPDGSLILKRDWNGRSDYRLVNPVGRDVAGASFGNFRRGTCGTSPEVARDGQWWRLSPGGKLDPPIYGSSC